MEATSQPAVSVIIVVRNGAAHIHRQLDALSVQQGALAGSLETPGQAVGVLEAFDSKGRPRPDANIPGPRPTAYLPFAPSGNMAISRSCFFALGGFDESLPPYGYEDVDRADELVPQVLRTGERGTPRAVGQGTGAASGAGA